MDKEKMRLYSNPHEINQLSFQDSYRLHFTPTENESFIYGSLHAKGISFLNRNFTANAELCQAIFWFILNKYFATIKFALVCRKLFILAFIIALCC
jgi:hypothetical protein